MYANGSVQGARQYTCAVSVAHLHERDVPPWDLQPVDEAP